MPHVTWDDTAAMASEAAGSGELSGSIVEAFRVRIAQGWSLTVLRDGPQGLHPVTAVGAAADVLLREVFEGAPTRR